MTITVRIKRWLGVSKLRLMGLIAATLVLGLVLTGQEGSPQPLQLPGIDVKDLECFHIKLLVPDGAPKVSAEQAREIAKSGDPFGLPVTQVALARFVEDGPDGVLRENLVWAVVSGDGSVREIGVPHPPGEGYKDSLPYTYDLALVDALTGEFISGMYGPPPPEYTCP